MIRTKGQPAYAVTKDQAYDAAVRILRNNPGFASLDQDRDRGSSWDRSMGAWASWVFG